MSNKVQDRVDELVQRLNYEASHAWLNLDNVSKIKTKSPLSGNQWGTLPVQDRILTLMRQPEYLSWTTRTLFGFECYPFQAVALREMWLRAFPMFIFTRGGSKTTLFGVYAILRALLDQGSKILLIGSSFRQAKGIFDVCSGIWYSSSMLRSLVDDNQRQGPRFEIDRCTLKLGDSVITAIPLGNGEKIRGLRATHLIVDEFKSVPLDIVENVVFGFAAVSKSPFEKSKEEAYKQYLKKHGLWSPLMEESTEKLSSNQTIVGGTAYWAWNHFAQYYQRYKGFIESQGDPKKYKRIFGVDMPDNFDANDFSIMRLSADMLPPKFMDEKTLARNKAVMSKANYLVEYGAIFVADSDGFFKRSVVEKCVIGKGNISISHPSCGEVFFKASMKGRPGCRYVIGIDPASQIDNFAITVLEVWPEHRRVVYCWTSRKADYEAARRKGYTTEKTFYSFCARKIRDLMSAFSPCVRLVMDSQGGGHQIAEALNDSDKLNPGERFIWPIIIEGEKKETDNNAGEHILELVNFSNGEWVSLANHGLKKDFEERTILFPYFDPAEIELALELDKELGRTKLDEITGEPLRLSDTLEDCIDNIEAMKDELATIVHTETINGREHWDTPQKKSEGQEKTRLRKDRYSALLLANASARDMALHPDLGPCKPPTVGGAAHQEAWKNKGVDSSVQMAPDWWIRAMGDFKGVVVGRG